MGSADARNVSQSEICNFHDYTEGTYQSIKSPNTKGPQKHNDNYWGVAEHCIGNVRVLIKCGGSQRD